MIDPSASQNHKKTSDSITIYQVSEIVIELRSLLETSYRNVWIEAELSSLSRPASGHWYFSLKDNSAQIRCAMFKGAVTQSFARTSYQPQEGDLVRVRGKVSVYPQRGDMQFIAQHMQPAGEGALRREFDLLKEKLNREGLFSSELKRPLPILPKCIGLVTSSTGAAIHDILSTLKRRFPSIPVRVYPSIVQGETAAQELITAVKLAEQDATCDVLIVTRGGGSLEDLWSFNDEQLARTIRSCSIPVISAVGHEVDVSICDYVADVRAATPTAAAEIITPDQNEYIRQLNHSQIYLSSLLKKRLESLAQSVDMIGQRLIDPRRQLNKQIEQLTAIKTRLIHLGKSQQNTKLSNLKHLTDRFKSRNPLPTIVSQQKKLDDLSAILQRYSHNAFSQKQDALATIKHHLHTVSPLNTLERGYSIVAKDASLKEVIHDANSTKKGDAIFVELGEGAIECSVLNHSKSSLKRR